MDVLKKYSPKFGHVNDAIAFVVHSSFLSEGCKLIGLSEEQYLDDLGSVPQGWNKSNEIYQLRYIDNKAQNQKQHKTTILVKILAMDQQQFLITAVKQSVNDVHVLELSANDYLNETKDLDDYENLFKDIDALRILVSEQITNKVVPSKDANKDEQKKNDEDLDNNNDDIANHPQHPLIIPHPHQPNPNPLLIGPPNGGDFGGDLDPFHGGGGNLFGPNQINQQWQRNRPPYVPPNARFDPFGPGANFPAGPDPDHMPPPNRPGRRRGGGSGGGGGFGGFGGII
jgi:proteasome inhibitor subunit 1 (PI31)